MMRQFTSAQLAGIVAGYIQGCDLEALTKKLAKELDDWYQQYADLNTSHDKLIAEIQFEREKVKTLQDELVNARSVVETLKKDSGVVNSTTKALYEAAGW